MKADITYLVYEAQNDPSKLNTLIEAYLPFIKRCVARSRVSAQAREDALTLGMLTFLDCVKAYEPEKGAFIAFAQTSIRNRLIDDFRGERKLTSLNAPLLEDGGTRNDWETNLSIEEYQRQLERTSLRLEIEEISDILKLWDTSFAELSKICPKQKRTRAQCEYISMLLLKNDAWRRQLLEKRRLPGRDMCKAYGVSLKTLEKYRKYIATLCIIQVGDYPMLRAFLPINRKGGVDSE